MKKIKYIILFIILPFYSYGQFENNNLKLTIYPSYGGANAYVIEVKNSVFSVLEQKTTLNEYGNVILYDTICFEEKKLKLREIKRINKHILVVKQIGDIYNDKRPFDAWIFNFVINKKEAVIINSSLLKNNDLKDTNKFIKFLIKKSPVKIKLIHFS